MASIAQRVWDYIDSKPAIKECIVKDVVNLSALARLICDDLKIESADAVLAACRRYPVDSKVIVQEETVKRLLRRSRIETRTKVATITLRYSYDLMLRMEKAINEVISSDRLLRVLQGTQGVVLILEENTLPIVTKIVGQADVIKIRKGLVEMAVISPENIENIPGVIYYLTSALASEGLNVIEIMSCYTDSVFIFEEKDMVKAFATLRKCME